MEEREQEEQTELFQMYVGQCLWAIDAFVHIRMGIEPKLPQYAELVHPETKKKPMTAEEIRQRTLKLLGW